MVHTTYTLLNLVRTIEQILGLPAVNQLDLAATPMFDAFTDTANLTPYTAFRGARLRPGARGRAAGCRS